jgi:hypothetical protein
MPKFKFNREPDILPEDRRMLRSLVTGDSRYDGSRQNYLAARREQFQEENAHNRFLMQQQNLELAQMKQTTEMMKARAAAELQMRTEQHTVRALEYLGKLSPQSPDFHVKMAEIFHENPLAAKDPLIQDMVKAQIGERHVQQTMESSIKEHEETQGSEFSRVHGVDVIRNKDGRIDWNASMNAATAAEKQRQSDAVAAVDPSLKPSSTKVVKGVMTQDFKAPTPDKPLPPTIVTKTEKASSIPGEAPVVTTTTRTAVPATPAGAGESPAAQPAATPSVTRLRFNPTTQSLEAAQ